ncbi:MAG: prolyl oligopeptidase family serine peptidase [Methanobacteriaceae archaeon]
MSIGKIKNKFVLDMDKLETFNFPLDEFCSLTVNYKKIKYEFLFRFSSQNKNLICFGSGAFSKHQFGNPPNYKRHSWEEDFDESVIYYNDPTLYDMLENTNSDKKRWLVGWCAGSKKHWYLDIIYQIIEILSKKQEIDNKNMLFFGSSGGGFTSLMLATMFKNSYAVVNNAQMFCEPRKFLMNLIRESCYNNISKEKYEKKYKYRTDIIEMIKKERYVPYAYIIVNLCNTRPVDEADLKDQFIPFIKELSKIEYYDNDKIKALFYYHNAGHGGMLDKEKTINIIKDYFITHAHKENQNYLEKKEIVKINENTEPPDRIAIKNIKNIEKIENIEHSPNKSLLKLLKNKIIDNIKK